MEQCEDSLLVYLSGFKGGNCLLYSRASFEKFSDNRCYNSCKGYSIHLIHKENEGMLKNLFFIVAVISLTACGTGSEGGK